jgi:cytochrome oxidase Cu insertion factor (SCO1/SenC/PrrC family)
LRRSFSDRKSEQENYQYSAFCHSFPAGTRASGDAVAAQKLASAYNDFAVKQGSAPNDSIAHSARLHVVTPDFRRRLIYATPDLNLELVEQDIRRLLKENKSESST